MTNQSQHNTIDDGPEEGGGTGTPSSTGSGVQKESKIPIYIGLGFIVLIAISVISSVI